MNRYNAPSRGLTIGILTLCLFAMPGCLPDSSADQNGDSRCLIVGAANRDVASAAELRKILANVKDPRYDDVLSKATDFILQEADGYQATGLLRVMVYEHGSRDAPGDIRQNADDLRMGDFLTNLLVRLLADPQLKERLAVDTGMHGRKYIFEGALLDSLYLYPSDTLPAIVEAQIRDRANHPVEWDRQHHYNALFGMQMALTQQKNSYTDAVINRLWSEARDHGFAEPYGSLGSWLAGSGRVPPEEAKPILLQYLREGKESAIILLRRNGSIGPAEVAEIAGHLDDPNPKMKKEVIEALGDFCARSATPKIQEALNHADLPVRQAAIEALGKLGDSASLPKFVEIYQSSPDNKTRHTCLQAIAHLPGKEPRRVLEQMKGAETDPKWQKEIERAMDDQKRRPRAPCDPTATPTPTPHP